MLSSPASDDKDVSFRIAAFQERLHQSGWTDGHNIRIDYRFLQISTVFANMRPNWSRSNPTSFLPPGVRRWDRCNRRLAKCRSFSYGPRSVGSGYVESLARPGGNATGFTLFEYDMSGKWLELLKEIAPGVTRVAVLRDAT